MYEEKELVISEEEGFLHPDVVDRELARLIKFYRLKLESGKVSSKARTGGDIVCLSRALLDRAIKGYKKAAMKSTAEESLIARLKILSKYHMMPEIWEDSVVKKKKPRKKKKFDKEEVSVTRTIVSEEERNKELESIPTFMSLKSGDEKEFFEYRKKYYLSEFEFNASSDLMLLETVLADEVLLRRLTNRKLSGGAVDERELNDIQNRYRKNLELLGVSRTQRLSAGSNQKGNVAHLSEALDEKLVEVNKLSNLEVRSKLIERLLSESTLINVEDVMQTIEELEYMRQRTLRPDIEGLEPIATRNELPVLEEIDAIIQEMDKKELN